MGLKRGLLGIGLGAAIAYGGWEVMETAFEASHCATVSAYECPKLYGDVLEPGGDELIWQAEDRVQSEQARRTFIFTGLGAVGLIVGGGIAIAGSVDALPRNPVDKAAATN